MSGLTMNLRKQKKKSKSTKKRSKLLKNLKLKRLRTGVRMLLRKQMFPKRMKRIKMKAERKMRSQNIKKDKKLNLRLMMERLKPLMRIRKCRRYLIREALLNLKNKKQRKKKSLRVQRKAKSQKKNLKLMRKKTKKRKMAAAKSIVSARINTFSSWLCSCAPNGEINHKFRQSL